jgi:hypothetical protein
MRDEWFDLRFFGWHKLNGHSMRLEIWRHFDLVRVACNHCSNGCEGLKRFAIWVCRPRRIQDHAVPSLEPPHWCLFSVVQLYEGSLDRSLRVIPRRDTDPEAARANDGVESSSGQVLAVNQRRGPQA